MVPPVEPSLMDQVTPVDCVPVVPLTVAVKDCTTEGSNETLVGEIETETAPTDCVTVTVADAVFEVSATLVATTWKVPADEAAV
jgi:hypothetical protein